MCHYTAYVFAVVFWFGDHAVLAVDGHGVVRVYLRQGCSIAVCCGHPFDLGSRAAVHRITARHNNRASAGFHRHNGCGILRLSWGMEGLMGEWKVKRKRVLERRSDDAKIEQV